VSQLRTQAKRGAARKSSPIRLKSSFKVGDRVRIVEIPEDLKAPAYDAKHDTQKPKLRTAKLFRFCLGRGFTVRGFGKYGHVELEVDEDRQVRKAFGKFNTIWIEPEFLKLVSRAGSANTRTRG
jgi:hypothetical protein